MLSCLASLWMAAALGQAPDQSAWLKSVPAEAAVVVRVKALETVRDDLLKMLEAMSPNAAALARPQLEQGLQMMAAQSGAESTKHPFFTLISLPKDGPMPGWCVMVQSDSYEGVLKSITKKDDFKSNPKDGLDSFDAPDGSTWYAAKGTGFVTFGPDQALVKGTLKPSASLSEKLSDEVRKDFLTGDLGIYANVAAIQAQYGEQIEQAKQAFMGMLDQAGGQMDAKQMQAAKVLYGAMFDSVKIGDAFALNLDFSGEALAIGGGLTVKAGSDAAKSLASSKTSGAAGIERLPAGAFAFTYSNPNPETIKGLSKLGLAYLTGGKSSPEIEKAQAAALEAGGMEAYQAMTAGGGGVGGMSVFNFSTPKDPEKAATAARDMLKAMADPEGMIKDVKLDSATETYKGFKLTKASVTYNLEKMTNPNQPGGVDAIKKLMGGDTQQTWFGTDGKTVLSVTAKSADDAHAKIDAFLAGDNSLGKTAAFKGLRGMLPKEVSGLFLVSAQGLVQFAAQTATAMSGKEATIPADMPKETALFGGSLVSAPKGYQFKFVVPSNVGPVIEKGLIPMIQGMMGQIQ